MANETARLAGRRAVGRCHVCLTCAAIRRRSLLAKGRGGFKLDRRPSRPISAPASPPAGGARLLIAAERGGAGVGRRGCYDGAPQGSAPSAAAILLLIRTAGSGRRRWGLGVGSPRPGRRSRPGERGGLRAGSGAAGGGHGAPPREESGERRRGDGMGWGRVKGGWGGGGGPGGRGRAGPGPSGAVGRGTAAHGEPGGSPIGPPSVPFLPQRLRAARSPRSAAVP